MRHSPRRRIHFPGRKYAITIVLSSFQIFRHPNRRKNSTKLGIHTKHTLVPFPFRTAAERLWYLLAAFSSLVPAPSAHHQEHHALFVASAENGLFLEWIFCEELPHLHRRDWWCTNTHTHAHAHHTHDAYGHTQHRRRCRRTEANWCSRQFTCLYLQELRKPMT